MIRPTAGALRSGRDRRALRSGRDRRVRRIVALVVAAIVLAGVLAAVVAIGLLVVAPPSHPSGLARTVLATRIVDGPVPLIADAVAVVALLVVLVRRWRRGALLGAGIGLVVGAGLAVGLLAAANAQNWFGVTLTTATWVWVIATFAAVGATIGSAVRAPGWRRLVAASAVVVTLVAGTLGVNAVFGIQRTMADFAGVSLARPVHLPVASGSASPSASASATGALWADWRAPKDMPTTGTTGTVDIPATVSGFHARQAGLYLPPAALVKDAPALPLMIFMMGQPGVPDPSWVATALNAYAARHQGLAPIVVVADQLGNPAVDTLCLDTARYGKVDTYITRDVLPWARAHLHVVQDAAHTIVGGYSNGGECALAFGAKYPELWSNVLDISGEAYPGSDKYAATLRTDFGGNVAAYRAVWPATLLHAGHYDGSFGVFTVGSNDTAYRAQAKEMVAAATAAGWQTVYAEIPNGGHVAAALRGGLTDGFAALYPRLGLSAPGTTP